jgi:hypothetical protein
MSAWTMRPGVARMGRFVRRWRFDRNPLRRATDRVETVVLILLIAAFAIGTPFAVLATGAWAHGASRQAQLAQEASSRQVTAVVVSVTAPPAGEYRVAWQARARWTAPDGKVVTAEVPVPSSVAAGQQIQVWTDLVGDLSTAPLLDSQVADQADFAAAFAVLGSAGVLVVAADAIVWALDKRRMAAWDAEWQVTGPRWTTRA